jgi:hypothetical protein
LPFSVLICICMMCEPIADCPLRSPPTLIDAWIAGAAPVGAPPVGAAAPPAHEPVV